MNRELIKNKFRGQQKDTNIWVYGNAIQCAGIWYIYNENENFRTPQDPDFENSFIEITPKTLGQFTGLYDKNGKEIYEGDIVRLSRSDKKITKVVFEKGKFLTKLNKSNYSLGGWETHAIKIIGNIHENPELL